MKHFSAVAAVVAALTMATSVTAQDATFFRIGTGGAGGTYFPIGALIANAISSPPGSRPCEDGGSCGVPGMVAIAQSTNASVHNNSAVQNGGLEAGLSGSSTLYEQYNGLGDFEGQAAKDLRVIANLFPEEAQIALPLDSEIDDITDLKGKRVSIGEAGSGLQVSALQILGEFGISRDDFTPVELNNAQAAERLADGQIDAYFALAGSPTAAIVQLASTSGMKLLSFTDEELAKIEKAFPYYAKTTIAANTYEGQDQPVNTFGVSTILVVNANASEDLIYNITKALWNDSSRKLFDAGHPKAATMRLETALNGVDNLGVPLHPGAKRAYDELLAK
ncbi:C4-dicarboxylate ABC transporter substrate-binding protein [Hoeflea sp. BAL378]|uniref:TAXI family TRAP transporter solute-binding subunit n=1 Tax=Hoeflea sp. BAL378 TaxID=1547437 RepID=UPI0005143FE4|nr:TAXI family TRAP transporter solute-binding subunit [Hoeflea sp. BAL378]KGF67497.1 C4-dicarboxylate ABC transporter substrate-binding protein [Hoeflea sp. BAL378]